MKKIVKARLYNFIIDSSDDFEDKAAGDYHDNGKEGTNTQEYNSETDTLTGMVSINSLIA